MLSDLIVGYLRDMGIYVSGNSAVTLRSIRQAKSFQEWRQDILLLKVSTGLFRCFCRMRLYRYILCNYLNAGYFTCTSFVWEVEPIVTVSRLRSELMQPPVPLILANELKKKRVGIILFKQLASSRLLSTVVRSLVNKTIGWVTPYAIRFTMKSLTPKESYHDKRGVGSALMTIAVVSNCYLNIDHILLTSILPTILGIMESHETRSVVENIVVDAKIPQTMSRALRSFSASIEDKILDVIISTCLEPVALGDQLMRLTGVSFDLQSLALASSFPELSAYLQQIMRYHAPVAFGDLARVVVEPLSHSLVSYAKDLANILLSVGAKALPVRVLSRPSVVYAALVDYYLKSPRVLDPAGQRFVYETFIAAFSDQVLNAFNPTNGKQPLAGSSPIQKIIFSTVLAPFENISTASDFFLWGPEWTILTKNYRLFLYRQQSSAVTGFIGHLQLTVVIKGEKIQLVFYVERMTNEHPNSKRVLRKLFGRKTLRFAYEAYPPENGSGGIIRIFTPENQIIAVLDTVQKPPVTQSFKQADIAYSTNIKLIKYIDANMQVLKGALDNLNSAFEGILHVLQLKKCAEAFKNNALFTLLLDFEYYTQPRWFSTDFHISFTAPTQIPGAAQMSVVPAGNRVYRVFAIDHFAQQEAVARIPADLQRPCRASTRRFHRVLSKAATWLTGTVYQGESKCQRKVQYTRDRGTPS